MLLVECNVLEKVEVINEGVEGNTRLRLRGKFQQCDEQNNNGRIYPRAILEAQVKAIQAKIVDRSLVGALDHPANDAIHLSQASHVITGLSIDKNGSVIGECEILSTPNGKIVEALLNCGVKIGISSRGVGSVTEGIKGKIVNEDFKLITFDLVSDPSTHGAFPELTESIRENSQLAQEIVTKHKSDRVLLTVLESKISEAMKKSKKKAKKKAKKKGGSSEFPDLSGDGKTTFKDILIGRGVINKNESMSDLDIAIKYGLPLTDGQKKVLAASGTTVPPSEQATVPPSKRKKKTENSSIDIRAAVIEGFKKVCWGDRYDEMGQTKRTNKAARQELDVQAGGQRPSLDIADTAFSRFVDAAKGDMSRVAKSSVAAGTQARKAAEAQARAKGASKEEIERAGDAAATQAEERAAAKVRARTTGIRAPVKPERAGLRTSTEIFGQKVVEAFISLIRKDELYSGSLTQPADTPLARHATNRARKKITNILRAAELADSGQTIDQRRQSGYTGKKKTDVSQKTDVSR